MQIERAGIRKDWPRIEIEIDGKIWSHPTLEFMQAQGWRVVAEVVKPDPTLDELKTQKEAEINAEAARRLELIATPAEIIDRQAGLLQAVSAAETTEAAAAISWS